MPTPTSTGLVEPPDMTQKAKV